MLALVLTTAKWLLLVFAVACLALLGSWLFVEFTYQVGPFYGPCEPVPFDGCE
jgi:hypothetical protein